MTNFVLCIHVQIRFASTEKNYSHRLACILFIYTVTRDNTSLCDIADTNDIAVLINDICIN